MKTIQRNFESLFGVILNLPCVLDGPANTAPLRCGSYNQAVRAFVQKPLKPSCKYPRKNVCVQTASGRAFWEIFLDFLADFFWQNLTATPDNRTHDTHRLSGAPMSALPPKADMCSATRRCPLCAKSGRSRQLWSSCIAEQSLQSHAARDGCEAIEFAEATYLVASIS